MQAPKGVDITNMALEAANVPVVAAKLMALPCTNEAEADALLALLAPKAEAGQMLKRINDARMAITRQLDTAKKQVMEYEATLIGPLESTIETCKGKVRKVKDATIAAQKQAEAIRNQKLADLDAMHRALVAFWETKRTAAMSHKTLEGLLELKAKADGYKAVVKAPDEWISKGLEDAYLLAANHQLANFKALLQEIADNWDNPEGRPMYVEPVAIPSLSVAKVEVLMDAPVEVVPKGMQTVLKPMVSDWRKVDAVGLVAALLADPTAVAKLDQLLSKLPKGCQVLGVDWVEEAKLVAR